MRALLFTALTCLITCNVHASNLRFLKDSVLSKFSAEESQQFRQFVGNALETLEDHKPVVWKSESGSAAGKFMAILTYKNAGKICRKSRFLLKSGDVKEPFQFDICKQDEGWKITATPVDNFDQSDWDMLTESVTEALNKAPNGAPLAWFNTKTGSSGSHVVLSRFTKKNKTCRAIAITIFDKQGHSLSGNYTFCQQADNSWQRFMTSPEAIDQPATSL